MDEAMVLEALETYRVTEECAAKLGRSFVSDAVMKRWGALPESPGDPGQLSKAMGVIREFYLPLLQHSNPETVHSLWARSCALFDAAVIALLKKGSPLLEDLPAVGAVVIGITRKEHTSAASGFYADLIHVACLLDQKLGLLPKVRTVKELSKAEFMLFEALEWELPQVDTYSCIAAMLLRADILTQGQHKHQLEHAWQLATRRCSVAVVAGSATGYGTARQLMYESLGEARMNDSVATRLTELCAPVRKNAFAY